MSGRADVSRPDPEFEQIQGHTSVQTTEKYLGCKQRLKGAVNDRIGSQRTVRRPSLPIGEVSTLTAR